MKTIAERNRITPGKPAWGIAELFPLQGYWSEEEYLELETNRLVEFTDGLIEVLPMPTTSHQLILAFLYHALLDFVQPLELGLALFCGIRVRLRRGKYRQPDIVFMLKEHEERIGEQYWLGADLVMEVVSGDPKDRERDLKKKVAAYARARIPEYWIVDPKERQIKVLKLKGKKYVVQGKFKPGTEATSALLPGFSVDVLAALAGKRK